ASQPLFSSDLRAVPVRKKKGLSMLTSLLLTMVNCSQSDETPDCEADNVPVDEKYHTGRQRGFRARKEACHIDKPFTYKSELLTVR
ncbi:MAG: hypothetical protein K5876_01320, partial [Ruminiclostridium sp.]|nr:hypothetical protein [Ruminiclostridium sp.]